MIPSNVGYYLSWLFWISLLAGLIKRLAGENMSETLDRFLAPSLLKPKQDPAIMIQDTCCNPKCKRKIPFNEPKYTLRIKGKEGVYCQTCAKKILHPHENTEENL